MPTQYNPKNRKYYDSLRNYIMTQFPREHELSLMKFVESAILEAYKNGQNLNKDKKHDNRNNSSY
jgi:hypothetical protein